MTDYIDFARLEAVSPEDFQSRKPYPLADFEGLLTPNGYEALLQNLPDLSLFEQKFGKERRAGQEPHDRYSLEYDPTVAAPQPWLEFIAELRSDRYRRAISRLLGVRTVEFRFHWHYTPAGCSVSPHCDAAREYGSQLFYFNREGEWDPSWGGETLVLDDGGRLEPDSAPGFEDFDQIIPFGPTGNRSLIISRRANGWHGVREIRCPEGQMRRVFIVVINPHSLYWRVRDRLIGKSIQRL